MKDWPEKSPQAAYVLGCGAIYDRIIGGPLPPAWLQVAEDEAIHRYGPPVLDNDQPITEDWLRAEGWVDHEEWSDRLVHPLRKRPHYIELELFNDGIGVEIDGATWPGPDPSTRGQLRALLTAIYGDAK